MTYEQALQKATKQLLTKKAKLLAEIGDLEAKLLEKKTKLQELEKDNAIEDLVQKLMQQAEERKKKELERAKQQLEQQGYKILEEQNTLHDAGEEY